MGPGRSTDLPSRPRFLWDGRNVPWTDGVGPQLRYAEAVAEWCKYHDRLPPASSNYTPKSVRGIVLKSQLFGRARDLVRSIDESLIDGDDGPQHIVDALHQRDALSVVSNVIKDFQALVGAKRNENETFKSFENRFQALTSKFHAHGAELALGEPILAFLLIHAAGISDHQRISIVSSLSSNLELGVKEEDGKKKTDAAMITSIKYESVASILRQCERDRTQPAATPLDAHSGSPAPSGGGGGNSGGRGKRKGGGGGGRKKRMTAEEIRTHKLNSQCHFCSAKGLTRYGHWATDHNPDGSLSPNFPSLERPANANAATAGQAVHDGEKNGNQNDKPEVGMTFMATLSSSSVLHAASTNSSTDSDTKKTAAFGPLVDDGAPFSALGEVEMRTLKSSLIYADPPIEDKPPELQGYDTWQYGSGAHRSAAKPILGAVTLFVRTKNNCLISVKHLLIKGSSKWVMGRNLTRKCTINHMTGNEICLPNGTDSLPLVDDRFHSYVLLERFTKTATQPSPSISTLSCAAATPRETAALRDWPSTRRVIDKVHRHVCGHASFSDIRTLLQRNGMWSLNAQKYLASVVRDCADCVASSTPPPNRRVSLKSLDRAFNSVLCIDHFHLQDNLMFHMMDSATRYSAAHVVSTTALEEVKYGLQSIWFAQFWPPASIHADGAFDNDDFSKFLRRFEIDLRPVPPRRHQKNPIESRHAVIRAIYLRIRHADPDGVDALAAIQSVTVSNDLYGNDTASSFELAKGFTKPVSHDSDLQLITPEVEQAHQRLVARRKLNVILRSNTYDTLSLVPGDLVQIYLKKFAGKRGHWTSPRQVLTVNKDGGFVVVPGRAGKEVKAAFEDVRIAPQLDDLEELIQAAVDVVDETLDDFLLAEGEKGSDGDDGDEHEVVDEENNATDHEEPSADGEDETVDIDDPVVSGDDDDDISDFSSPQHTPSIGDRIEVYWPLDDKFYPGEVRKITRGGKYTVVYDDNEKEKIDIDKERWRFAAPLTAASSIPMTLKSSEQELLQSMMKVLGQRPFLLHHAQGFDQSAMVKAYRLEEEQYLRTVKVIPRPQVPADANIIGSHTVYKIKTKDDDSLKLKGRIAPHGNEDSDTIHLRTTCVMCPPLGIRITFTVSVTRKWKIKRVDAEVAFHQTGAAERQVYVRPPRESNHKRVLWLLLVAGYGLTNAGAKWQRKSDEAMIAIGMQAIPVIPQLFGKFIDGNLALLAIKIVDDILLTGTDDELAWFERAFGGVFKLGESETGPGRLRFYGLQIEQAEDFSCSVHADDKLQALEAYPLARVRRRQHEDKMNAVELASFRSVNSSISWLGTVCSPMCAFYASSLQQRLPSSTVHDLVAQQNALSLLKKHGTLTTYPTPPDIAKEAVNLVAFADASFKEDKSQLAYVIGLVFGDVKKDSVFHLLSWASHKSRRPVHSTPAAEILAASEAIDELMMLKNALDAIFEVRVHTYVLIDSKDLYSTLSTQKNSVDRSVRAAVNCIRFTYETELDVLGWISGQVNIADVGTKENSPLTDALVLMLATGRITVDLSSQETKSYDKRLG